MATAKTQDRMAIKVEEVTSPEGMKAILAEGIATFAFVFLGTGAVVSAFLAGGGLNGATLAAIAAAHGLAILLLVAAFGRISGAHINPAVSFALMVTGKTGIAKGIAYIVFQCIGAAAASLLLMSIVPDAVEGGLGANSLDNGISTSGAFILEAVLTFFLVWVIFSVAVDKKGPGFPIAPVAIGLTVLVAYLVTIPFTGVSLNPARTFGPALATGEFANHWIYWAAPLLGGALAAITYTVMHGKES